MKLTDEQYQALMICAKLGHSTTPEVLISILEDRKALLAAPTPPKSIYDEEAERSKCRKAWALRSKHSHFEPVPFPDYWAGWKDGAQSRAKAGEADHE